MKLHQRVQHSHFNVHKVDRDRILLVVSVHDSGDLLNNNLCKVVTLHGSKKT